MTFNRMVFPRYGCAGAAAGLCFRGEMVPTNCAVESPLCRDKITGLSRSRSSILVVEMVRCVRTIFYPYYQKHVLEA